MNTNITIDEVKFFKTSKKLLSKLNDTYSLEMKLNQVQEFLAESLGFRNLNALQSVFSNNEDEQKVLKPISKKNIFQDIEHDQALQIILNLMNDNEDGLWKSRAISLMSTVLSVIICMRDQKELIFDNNTITEYLILDNIIKTYKTRRDFPDNVRSEIRAYLNSLPGYNNDLDIGVKQNNVVYEQHGYLQMQFLKAIDQIKKIENNDFIIADRSWFYLNKRENLLSGSGGSKESPVKAEIIEYLCINESLLQLVEDSWVVMPEYEEYIIYLEKNKKLITVKISDLLVYTTMIIPTEKRKRMYCLLNSIISNYSIASNISKNICSVVK